MKKAAIKEILYRYSIDQCSDEEKARVEEWYNRYKTGSVPELSDEDIEQDLLNIFESLPHVRKIKRIKLWPRIAAAVVLLFALGVAFYPYFERASDSKLLEKSQTLEEASDIAPGGNKAILTLADGSTIVLDDADNGNIAEQHGLKISKTEDGKIVYTSVSSEKGSSLSDYNKIATPRGGQYEIILPDGTKVWLNSASSLKYPTVFTGRERNVELTGEAYFEVMSISKVADGDHGNIEKEHVPFVVHTPTQSVRVLGTHFNINAYEDEPSTKTTLLEGSVQVIPNTREMTHDSDLILKPGEQATLVGSHTSIAKVNTANAVAWKSGLFQFQDSDIPSVMRQLSRWYDVDVEFEGQVPDIKLWGEVHRNVNASQALEILEYFNLNYRIEQHDGVKKIIIS